MELAPCKSRNGRTLDKSRRVWLPKEEEVLIAALKDITTKGWKCENGFRTGYLHVLEREMIKAFPNTDIKAEPHINSKIHVWKKFHKSMTSMLAQRGITWNENEKTIEARDDAWDAYVKTDIHARTMRYKPWPLFDDWCEIFGRDRATGENAEDFDDTVPGTEDCKRKEKYMVAEFCGVIEGLEDKNEISVCQPQGSETNKEQTPKKRKLSNCSSDALVDAITVLREKTDVGLKDISSGLKDISSGFNDITKKIEHEFYVSNLRKEVYATLGKIPGLGIRDKIIAGRLLVNKTPDLEFFFSLPDEVKDVMVNMLLAEKI